METSSNGAIFREPSRDWEILPAGGKVVVRPWKGYPKDITDIVEDINDNTDPEPDDEVH